MNKWVYVFYICYACMCMYREIKAKSHRNYILSTNIRLWEIIYSYIFKFYFMFLESPWRSHLNILKCNYLDLLLSQSNTNLYLIILELWFSTCGHDLFCGLSNFFTGLAYHWQIIVMKQQWNHFMVGVVSIIWGPVLKGGVLAKWRTTVLENKEVGA